MCGVHTTAALAQVGPSAGDTNTGNEWAQTESNARGVSTGAGERQDGWGTIGKGTWVGEQWGHIGTGASHVAEGFRFLFLGRLAATGKAGRAQLVDVARDCRGGAGCEGAHACIHETWVLVLWGRLGC